MKKTTLSILLTSVLAAGTAHANVNAAARAFADGQAAQLNGDYDHAAASFELANSIMESKEALRSAVRARQLSGQLARAATLAESLLVKYASDPQSVKLANDVLIEARAKLGRIQVTCAEACSLAGNQRALGLTAAVTHLVYVQPGSITLDVSFSNDRTTQRRVVPLTGTLLELKIDAPPMPIAKKSVDAQKKPASRGLPRTVPITTGVITVAIGGIAIWSGLDTLKAHDAYEANPDRSTAEFDKGRSKQLRTNLLLAGTGVAALSTLAIAAFWTDWKGDPKKKKETKSIAVAPTDGGLTFAYGASF
jgi:hypothetical protein